MKKVMQEPNTNNATGFYRFAGLAMTRKMLKVM
jgi:hypothetical protein